MRKIVFCFSMPHNGGYFGGIANIINQYMMSREIFFENDFDVELFDYYDEKVAAIKNSKERNIVYGIKQRKALVKALGKDFSDIVHIHTSRKWLLLKDLLLCKYLKKNTKALTVITIHFADIDKILYSNSVLRRIQMNLMNSFVDKIILLSQNTKKEFVEAGIEQNKLEVLYTFHSFNNTKTSEVSVPVNLLFVGSLDKRKGIIDLLKALKCLKNEYSFILHICGQLTDPEIKDEFNNLLNDLGNSVVNHGYVSGIEKQSIYELADVLVLPSYGEGMPIVIMEALATGCAIVCTNVGAIPEIVKTENGLLFAPGDIDALTDSIRLYIDNKECLEEVKKRNSLLGETFGLKQNIVNLCDIYRGEI